MEKKTEKPVEEAKRKDAMKVSRRDFLKGMATSAVAATISTLPGPALPEAEAAVPSGIKEAFVTFNINDKAYRVKVKSNWTLLDVLRRELDLTGTKKACDHGNCGACTVIVDGKVVYACSQLAISMDGKKILTIEGLRDGEKLHPIQKAFSEEGGYQCGFCTPGQMMAAKALLDKNLKPTPDQVRIAMAGNLCRCGSYPKIIQSVLSASQKLRGGA